MHCNEKDFIRHKPQGSILIIEDSVIFHKALRKSLLTLGYEVTIVTTLKATLDILGLHTYDLIILDLNLPDGEGEEILLHLTGHQKLKIVVYTSDVDKDRRNEWFRYGVLGYLSKTDPLPFVVKEIDKIIKSILENTHYNILIVDDSRFICQQITALLQPRNYQVSTVGTGVDAKQALKDKNYDLIILDLELPDINGEEILKHIKHHKAMVEIPIFILTGHYDSTLVGRLIKQGANEFFLKPFIAEELLLKIDFWIEFQRKAKENLCQRKILKEYKEAVDRSAIVSKTNKKGIITFVNDQFCAISGYTQHELLGQSHNIVRHPDVSPEVFKEMWETILSGHAWQGIIKNRKKDGSPYWVNAVVNPIIDSKGHIVEFIAIRTDITDIEMIRENLRAQLRISENNFEDAYYLAQQYEQAISESNILTRTNLAGDITYANQLFLETTGYCEAEVIGQKHSLIRHKDTPKELFSDLWKTIQNGKIWRGVIKNRKKDGSPYWVYSVILPIKDKQGEIIEYMSIRNEITELISLHQEIEDTQQEVIYRMGEIAESRNKETGNHVKRVAEYSRLLALKVGLDEKEADLLASASPMHDIGKVGIPDVILLKPGSLTPQEWDIMRSHSMLGFNVLKNSERILLKTAAIIAKEHHEKWNGMGYPDGLVGEAIHPYARIVAIADVFDALSHARPYKPIWDDAHIFEFLKEESGKHFDPKLIDIFFEHLEEFLAIKNYFKDD